MWWQEAPLTPRQRDVQAAHRVGFWYGLRVGLLLAALVACPFVASLMIWWYWR